jgi:hypothetical protein
LIVVGPEGSGKTSLVTGMGTDLAFQQGKARLTTLFEFLQIADMPSDPHTQENRALWHWTRSQVLLFDDVDSGTAPASLVNPASAVAAIRAMGAGIARGLAERRTVWVLGPKADTAGWRAALAELLGIEEDVVGIIMLGEVLPKEDEVYQRKVTLTVKDLRDRDWCALKTADIETVWFDSDSDFFQARPRFLTTCVRRRRQYVLMVNRRGGALALGDTALTGVLAHELDHLMSYHERSRLVCLAWSLVTLLFPDRCVRFERRADLRTVYRGFSEGLGHYRQWLYAQVSPAVADLKRRVYLTPEEILEVDQLRRSHPELEELWIRTVPRDLAGFRDSVPRQ